MDKQEYMKTLGSICCEISTPKANEVADGLWEHIEALEKENRELKVKTTKDPNPWCLNCTETDCCVSFDGTCEMVRVYLGTKEADSE